MPCDWTKWRFVDSWLVQECFKVNLLSAPKSLSNFDLSYFNIWQSLWLYCYYFIVFTKIFAQVSRISAVPIHIVHIPVLATNLCKPPRGWQHITFSKESKTKEHCIIVLIENCRKSVQITNCHRSVQIKNLIFKRLYRYTSPTKKPIKWITK